MKLIRIIVVLYGLLIWLYMPNLFANYNSHSGVHLSKDISILSNLFSFIVQNLSASMVKNKYVVFAINATNHPPLFKVNNQVDQQDKLIINNDKSNKNIPSTSLNPENNASLFNSFNFSPFVLNKINIDGLYFVDKMVILQVVNIKPGEEVTEEKCNQLIKQIYNTGLFYSINLEKQGENDLLIKVVENSIISDIVIKGENEIDKSTIRGYLKEFELSESLILKRNNLSQFRIKLGNEYLKRGYYFVNINIDILQDNTNSNKNRVKLIISIKENDRAKIRSIYFVGNSHVDSNILFRKIKMAPSNWLSWFYKDDLYELSSFNRDLETIKSYYYSIGYIDANIISSQINLSQDKKHFDVVINIYEGKQYKLGVVTIDGDFLDVPEKNLRQYLSQLQYGKVVNQNEINQLSDKIKMEFGKYGYAFATTQITNSIARDRAINQYDEQNKQDYVYNKQNISSENNNKSSNKQNDSNYDIENINQQDNAIKQSDSVNYLIIVNPGKKIYIRNINIKGNTKTRDVVIRRELRQLEFSMYNFDAIKRSKERIEGTGFFKLVNFSFSPVEDANNQMDLNITIEENRTANMNFGLGYTQNQGFIFNYSFSHDNILGSGKSGSFSASFSNISSSFNVNFFDPYFLSNGTGLGYEVYGNIYQPSIINLSPFKLDTLGAKTRISIPVSEYDRINFGVGFEHNEVSINRKTAPERFIHFVDRYGKSLDTISLSAGWSKTTVNNPRWPSSGYLINEHIEATAPISDMHYYRITSQGTMYNDLPLDLILKTYAKFGFINAYSKNQIVPFYQNYTEGGINSVRGFSSGRFGVLDVDGFAYGGTRMALLSNEVVIPIIIEKHPNLLRLSLFNDMGTLWGVDPFNTTPTEAFRASYGIALNFNSPLGLIKLSYAWPLFSQPLDEIQRLQFAIGVNF